MSIVYADKTYPLNEDIIGASGFIKFLITECDDNKEICLSEYQDVFEMIYYNKYDMVEKMYNERDIKGLEHLYHGFKYFQADASNFFKNITMSSRKKSREQLVSFFEKHILGVDMMYICKNKIIPLSFYKKHHSYLTPKDWEWLCSNENIPVDFFVKNISHIQVDWLCDNEKIPTSFFEKYIKYITGDGFAKLAKNTSISMQFYDRHIRQFKLLFHTLAENPSITLEFYNKHKRHFKYCQDAILMYSTIVQSLNEYHTLYYFDYIFQNKHLPISFLEQLVEKHQDELYFSHWRKLCTNPSIPRASFIKYEQFRKCLREIEESKINRPQPSMTPFNVIEDHAAVMVHHDTNESRELFTSISRRSDIPHAFIDKYFRYINWSVLCLNPYIPLSIYEKYIYRVNWTYLSQKETSAEELIFQQSLSFYKYMPITHHQTGH